MELLAIVLAVLVVGIVSYGSYLFWSWVFAMRVQGKSRELGQLAAFAFALVAFSISGHSFASTPTLEFDLTPFFDSLNAYLPIFIGLFAIVGGIAGAMALARYVVSAVVRAFSGGTI